MIVTSVIIVSLYCFLIIAFSIGFHLVNDFKPENITPTQKFTVIIPFRNEEKALPSLLKSIQTLKYPYELFEILFVDDASEDDSIEIIEKYLDKLSITFTILKNDRITGSPKKDAINTAIAIANSVNKRPTFPDKKTKGTNTATKTNVVATTAKATSLPPS